ncbi:MAG TPA: hypothetical protein VFG28_13270 [Syntrophales bacterium]|nr:hypothetical protein [Syntrophales bacterium]
MKKRISIVLAAGLVCLWAFPVQPLHAQSRDAKPPKQIGPVSPSEKAKQGQVDQPEERQAPRNAWLQGDEKQQEKLTGCFRLSSVLYQHALAIRKMLIVSEVDWKEVAAQYEDLKRGTQQLMEKHEEFTMQLNNGQRSWWERQLQDIMLIELQLNERSEAIGRQLNGEKPGSAQLAKVFADLEGQFRKWNNYYRQIGADMNIQDLEQQAAPIVIRGITGAQNPKR